MKICIDNSERPSVSWKVKDASTKLVSYTGGPVILENWNQNLGI